MTSKPFVAFASLALLSALAFGQFVRNPKTEQPICDQLGAVALGAVETFQQATSAMDNREFQQAIPLFQSVLQQAPLFTPAMRRLGASLAESGQLDEGLTYCRRALKIVLSTAVGELGLQKQVGACDNSRTIGPLIGRIDSRNPARIASSVREAVRSSFQAVPYKKLGMERSWGIGSL